MTTFTTNCTKCGCNPLERMKLANCKNLVETLTKENKELREKIKELLSNKED